MKRIYEAIKSALTRRKPEGITLADAVENMVTHGRGYYGKNQPEINEINVVRNRGGWKTNYDSPGMYQMALARNEGLIESENILVPRNDAVDWRPANIPTCQSIWEICDKLGYRAVQVDGDLRDYLHSDVRQSKDPVVLQTTWPGTEHERRMLCYN